MDERFAELRRDSQVLGIVDFSQPDIDAIARSEASPEANKIDHEVLARLDSD
jgi:hypothetical protein